MTLSAAQITAQQKFIVITPVGGTTFNQLKDGSMRVYINRTNAERFKQEILRFCSEIDRYLIACLEADRDAERQTYVVPKSRIQELEEELDRLRGVANAPGQVVPLRLETPAAPVVAFLPPGAMGTENDQTRASALAATGGVPAAPACLPVDPNFDEEKARAQTIVSGGFEPGA